MGRTEKLREGWLAAWRCVVSVQQLPVPSVPFVLVLLA